MSAIASDSQARDWAIQLEDAERMRSGLPLREARGVVARRTGIAPGTLERLRRDRLKGVREWVYARLHAAVIAELQREIRAHAHELETLERLGRDRGDIPYQEALAGRDALFRRLTDETTQSLNSHQPTRD